LLAQQNPYCSSLVAPCHRGASMKHRTGRCHAQAAATHLPRPTHTQIRALASRSAETHSEHPARSYSQFGRRQRPSTDRPAWSGPRRRTCSTMGSRDGSLAGAKSQKRPGSVLGAKRGVHFGKCMVVVPFTWGPQIGCPQGFLRTLSVTGSNPVASF
jgi:hypothetical protein